MGTKRSIASHVSRVIEAAPQGALLDLFSGMCAISTAVATSRQIWCNDVQIFASSVARAFFTSPEIPLHADQLARDAVIPFRENCASLLERFAHELFEEKASLQFEDIQQVRRLESIMPNVASGGSIERERTFLAENPETVPYRLFAITFSGGYFSLRQSIEIDSIRYAIDNLRDLNLLNEYQHEWMCLALCQAVSKVSTTTGHFAQHMRINERNRKRFIAQRNRSVWHEWLRAIFELGPIGTRPWRSRNKVFSLDGSSLLHRLCNSQERPAVVYADPPYTQDHYSRYYHLYETLLLYDYPESRGSGRYRPDRFCSPFSTKRSVGKAMEDLISKSAMLGAHLVLSYPSRGVLSDSQSVIPSLIRKYFGMTAKVTELDNYHSSLGASKGVDKHRVKELIYAAG